MARTNKETKQDRPSLFLGLIVCLIAVAATASIALTTVDQAHARTSDSATIVRGDQIPYAGYSTGRMTIDSVPAYCGQPTKATPQAGSYPKSNLSVNLINAQATDKDVRNLASAIYYGWGGPGFDASMWPSTWYDGSAMTPDRYWALTHILVADLYCGDGVGALHGCNDDFKRWVFTQILAYDWYNGTYNGFNANSYETKLYQLADTDTIKNFVQTCYIVNTGSNSQVIVSYEPSGWIDLDKDSSNSAFSSNNASYSLSGAQYSIYRDAQCGSLVTQLTTNEDGYAKSANLLPGTYYVKETLPSKGFALDSKVYTVKVNANATTRVNGSKVFDNPQYDPTNLVVAKYDHEKEFDDQGNVARGGASLSGAEFKVSYYDKQFESASEAQQSGEPYRTWTFRSDAQGFVSYNENYLVRGDALYTNSKNEPALPLGSLVIQETKAPTGYVLNEDLYFQKITSQDHAEVLNVYHAPEVPNRVKRGDLNLIKVGENGQDRLANIPFKITSKTTNESHILVTDSNGYASTSSSFNPHTQLTNINDQARDNAYRQEAGVWFSKDAKGDFSDPNNSLGALPYDTYIIEELRCAANEGLQLINKQEIVVTRDNFTLDLGTINDAKSYISTSAYDAVDKDKYVVADDKACIDDVIHYTNLVEGRSYTVKGTLYSSDHEIAQAQTTFTANEASGTTTVAFTFDASQHANEKLWIKEELMSESSIIATHDDPDDPDQSVQVIDTQLATSAQDAIDGDSFVVNSPKAHVTDTVKINNAIPGMQYRLEGRLMVKTFDVDGRINGATPLYVTSDGKITTESSDSTHELSVSKEFFAKSAQESQSIDFEFDSSGVEDLDLVVFEKLFKVSNNNLVAEHENPSDEGQSIKTVTTSLKTTANDKMDSDHVVSDDNEACIVDTVTFSNLIAGKEYRLVGQLMSKVYDEQGTVVGAEPLLLTDSGSLTTNPNEGNYITSQMVFIAEDQNETHDLDFTFNALHAKELDLVVYETLYETDSETPLAEHKDPNDEGQSITSTPPIIQTKVADSVDADQSVIPDEESSIVDRIDYSNVVQDISGYSFGGIVINKDTGLPLLVGEEATSISEDELRDFCETLETALSLERVENDREATADENGENLFEMLSDFFNPAENQNASDQDSKQPDLLYSEYEVVGKVDIDLFKQAIEEHSSIWNSLVRNHKDFEPDRDHGSLELEYSFDSSTLESGTELVVFEIGFKTLDDGTVYVISSETNPDNPDQTFTIQTPSIQTEMIDQADGDHTINLGEQEKLIDQVRFKGLIADGSTEYVLSGILMDKNTGSALLVDGQTVESEVRFSPNTADGSIEVPFELNSSDLDGKAIVAFERLTKQTEDGEREVAIHEDLQSESQSVTTVKGEGVNGSLFGKTGFNIAAVIVIAIGLIAVGVSLVVRHVKPRIGKRF